MYVARKSFAMFAICLLALTSGVVFAGGIELVGTRVIYPVGERQVSLSVRNTNDSKNYLVQSWVDTPSGEKSSNIIVTPPLYTSSPNSENILRIVSTGADVPKDREKLYYLNVKGVPAVDKNSAGSGIVIAVVTRIKLFVRPAGLKPAREAATAQLRFVREGKRLKIINPTPYYLTLTNLKVGKTVIESVMVSPLGSGDAALSDESSGNITFNSIADHGGEIAHEGYLD